MTGTLFSIAVATNIANKEASKRSSRAISKTSQLKQEIRNLKADIAKSMLINEALWELISKKLNLTEHDLHKKIYEIDMRDGKLDGKNQQKAVQCPNCNHRVSRRHPACIYCGTVMDSSTFSTG